MKKILITLSLLLAFSSFFQAQDMSRRQHMKFAKKMLKSHNYLDAAAHFEKASEQKHSDDLYYEAAVNYSIARDYASAKRCFSKINDENDYDDLLLLKGQILKNLGQYEAATQAFSSFIKSYDKKDKVKKENLVSAEIKGCELALDQNNPSFDLELLSENINSPEENEFAPFQVGDNLYFSSTMGDFMNIYRSELEDGNWLFSVIPQNFNQLQGKNFCNGSFSADLTKFYFNICQTNSYEQNDCSIYLIENEGGTWSDPKKLGENINTTGTTNTHPVSTIKDGKEYLYFSSNRANGQGGLDLWYVSKPIDSDYSAFSKPRNLGPNINTTQNEITPFYTNGVLYFSSNGHPSFGGYDIFKSKGMAYKWSKAANVGTPLNSSADDTNYFLNDDGKFGYITSNRNGIKASASMDDDIFAFYPAAVNYSFSGNVYDKASSIILDDISVTVYEKNGGNENLLTAQDFPNGNFNLGLLPNKELILSISKPGYKSSKISISTFTTDAIHQDKNIYLEQDEMNPTASTASIDASFPIEESSESQSAENSKISESNNSKIVTPKVSTPAIEKEVVSYNESSSPKESENIISTPSVSSVTTSSHVSTTPTSSTMPSVTKSYESSILSAPVVEKEVVTYNEASTSMESSVKTASDVSATSTSSALPSVIKSYEPSISAAPSMSTSVTKEALPSVIKSYEPAIQSAPIVSHSKSNSEQLPSYIKSYEPELKGQSTTQPAAVEYTTDQSLNYDGAVYSTRSSTKYEPGAFSTNAKKYSGVYYKVQLMAIKKFDPSSSRFKAVVNLGELDTEYLYDKGLTRVLLSHFISLDDAKDVRDYARKNGFKGAFIVKYEDGERQGQHF